MESSQISSQRELESAKDNIESAKNLMNLEESLKKIDVPKLESTSTIKGRPPEIIPDKIQKMIEIDHGLRIVTRQQTIKRKLKDGGEKEYIVNYRSVVKNSREEVSQMKKMKEELIAKIKKMSLDELKKYHEILCV